MPFFLPFLFPLHLYVILRFLLAPALGRMELRALRGPAPAKGSLPEGAAPAAGAPEGAKLRYYQRFVVGNLISGATAWALWSLLPAIPLHWGTVMGGSARNFVAAFAIGGGIGGVLGEGVELLPLRRKQGKYAIKRRKVLAAKAYLLPVTVKERQWWIAVSCMGRGG